MMRLLLITGASIFLLLGVAHGVLTIRDLSNPSSFTPRDPDLRAEMQKSTIAFHPRVNLWKAWLGFNLTHSLGIIIFGGAFLYVGIFHSLLFSQSPFLQVCSILVSAAYLVISLNFFFSTPAIGSGIAMMCFVVAAALSYR